MASPLSVTMLLCDAAQADPSGKVHILGAGWSTTGTPTAPAAVAVFLKIPWDRANEKIPISLFLYDADGHLVTLPGVDRLGVENEVEVGRPPGITAGSNLDAAFTVPVPSLPLTPGRYQWRVDSGQESFSVSFEVQDRSQV